MSKNKKEKTKNKSKQTPKKEGLGPSEVAFRVTSPDQLFSYQSEFSFGGGVQKLPFWQLAPRNAHPKNYKIWVSANQSLKTSNRHETAVFGQKPKPENPVIIFLICLLFEQQGTQNIAENPIFIGASSA